MKKVILFAAVAVTVALASCKPSETAETVDSTAVVVEEVVTVDTAVAVVDTTVVAE